MNSFEIADRMEITHWKLDALEAVETTPFMEDKINLEAFIADADVYLEVA